MESQERMWSYKNKVSRSPQRQQRFMIFVLESLSAKGGLVFWKICGVLLFKKSSTVATGILYGGALLALDILLGIFSLKVWRQWNSSLPLLLGQAALLWHFSGSIFITILCSQDFCIWSEFRSLKLSSSDLHIVQLIWINNLTDSVFQ